VRGLELGEVMGKRVKVCIPWAGLHLVLRRMLGCLDLPGQLWDTQGGGTEKRGGVGCVPGIEAEAWLSRSPGRDSSPAGSSSPARPPSGIAAVEAERAARAAVRLARACAA
jgi:hypothetical protein